MPKPTDRKLNDQNNRFAMNSPIKFPPADTAAHNGDKKRKFSGVAYAGGIIKNHWYWGNVIFDMASMDVPDRLPVLVDHDRSKRAGYVVDFKIDNNTGFTVDGVLLSNKDGTAVAQDSDEGFPWQMSVHIEPRSIEEFALGEQTTVNGHMFIGPLTVFRNSTIVEVSFTATGQDSNTSATAMAYGGIQSPTIENPNDMTPEQIAAMQQENIDLKTNNATLIQERDAARSELSKFNKECRENDIKTLFSAVGREYKADDVGVKILNDMPQIAFDAMADMMRNQFKNPNAGGVGSGLFNHIATGHGVGSGNPIEEDGLFKDAEKRATQFHKRL